MSFVLLGILNAQAAGGGGSQYFIQKLGDKLSIEGGIVTDSNNNYYTATVQSGGDNAPVAYEHFYIQKSDKFGATQWQRLLYSQDSMRGGQLALDTNNNLYICGNEEETYSGADACYVAKYSTSGAKIWEKSIRFYTGGQRFNSVETDSTHIYLCGSDFTNNVIGLLVKLDLNGNIQFTKSYELSGSGFDNLEFADLAVDPTGNIYTVGYARADRLNPHVTKFDSNGNIQWSKVFRDDNNSNQFNAIEVDANGDLIIGGKTRTFAPNNFPDDMWVVKMDTSGNPLWQKSFSGGNGTFAARIAIDSNNNYFFFDEFREFVVKINESGTLLLQRDLNGITNGEDISVNNEDDFLVLARVNADDTQFVGYLPGDGSLEGSYNLDGNTVEYTAGNLTVNNIAPSFTATPIQFDSSSTTVTTPSFNSVSTSETIILVNL